MKIINLAVQLYIEKDNIEIKIQGIDLDEVIKSLMLAKEEKKEESTYDF